MEKVQMGGNSPHNFPKQISLHPPFTLYTGIKYTIVTCFVLLSTMNFSRICVISHCLSPCITNQWNASWPSYISIRPFIRRYLTLVKNIGLIWEFFVVPVIHRYLISVRQIWLIWEFFLV